jgi:hypothetical protein
MGGKLTKGTIFIEYNGYIKCTVLSRFLFKNIVLNKGFSKALKLKFNPNATIEYKDEKRFLFYICKIKFILHL